ncbi:MAG: DUF3810 family protein [Acidobacteriota bacterium]|nr:DUF3810 family protein [Acidobacteriota bacterium]
MAAKSLFQACAILGAALVALFPLPSASVERWYAKGIYPAIQANLTAASNSLGLALFDTALIIFVSLLIGGWVWWIRGARKQRSFRPIVRGVVGTITGAAIIYLWFLAAWGLNYARPPLESVLAYDASRITPLAVRALAERAVSEANRTHAAAHAAGFPAIAGMPAPLAAALHDVERELGRPRPTVLAQPKRSLLSPFFRASGVSGMLGPFFLETLLNPDLTGPERPIVLAHEWAHLSGYAPESDASYVGFLAALRAGPASQYSAWLDLVSEAASQLQPITQRLVLEQLAPGPRADQEAIRQRLKALVKPVERVAWTTYDRMLKSQGVEEGVQSYSRVVQLILGTNAVPILTGTP